MAIGLTTSAFVRNDFWQLWSLIRSRLTMLFTWSLSLQKETSIFKNRWTLLSFPWNFRPLLTWWGSIIVFIQARKKRRKENQGQSMRNNKKLFLKIRLNEWFSLSIHLSHSLWWLLNLRFLWKLGMFLIRLLDCNRAKQFQRTRKKKYWSIFSFSLDLNENYQIWTNLQFKNTPKISMEENHLTLQPLKPEETSI